MSNALPSSPVGVDESSSGPPHFELSLGSSVSPRGGEAISTRGYDVLDNFLSWTFNQLITGPADRKYWIRRLGAFSEEGGLWLWSLD